MRSESAAEGDLRRARALVDLGRIEGALTALRRILAGDPRNAEALELVGLCLIRQGRALEARVPLGEALARLPERAHLHYLMGFAAGMASDVPGAERGLGEALRLEPEEPVYLRALAEHYADRGRPADAVTLAERAVGIDPDRASNHRTLGYVTSSAGDHGRAEAAYRQAIRLDPHDAVAWNNLGCVLLSLGRKLEAREQFREALRLDPTGERARKNLALVAPSKRPPAIHRDFDALLGEALRELYDAGRLAPSLRTTALALAAGRSAIAHALKGRLESRGARGRVAAAAGTVAAAAVARRLRPASLPAMGIVAAAAGVGYFATAHRVTPERRRFVEIVAAARRQWEATRTEWLDGKLSRAAREAQVERQLERLAVALDSDSDVEAPPDARP
jgi:Flp pilus assembly protein TadD